MFSNGLDSFLFVIQLFQLMLIGRIYLFTSFFTAV